MQYDVISAHLNGDGFAYLGRIRLKGLVIAGQSSAGTVDMFDTADFPIAATYGQADNTITVTSAGHALSTGDRVGIAFEAAGGVSGTDGNYTVTVLDDNTFTIESLNTASVATGTVCYYVTGQAHAQWVTSFDTSAVTAGGQIMQILLPGDGILIEEGLYINVSNITGVTLFLG